MHAVTFLINLTLDTEMVQNLNTQSNPNPNPREHVI